MRRKRRTRRKARRRRRRRSRRRRRRRMRGGMKGLFKNYISEKAFPPGNMYKVGCSEVPCGTFYGYQCKTSCHPKSTVGQMLGGRKSRRKKRRRKRRKNRRSKKQRGGQVGKSISPSRSKQFANKIGVGLRSITPTPFTDVMRNVGDTLNNKYNNYQGSRVETSASVMDQPIKYQMRGNINSLAKLEDASKDSNKSSK